MTEQTCCACNEGKLNHFGWCSVCQKLDYDRTNSLLEVDYRETNIKQQSHYTQHKIQQVCFIGENKIDFLAGNVIKYVSRYNFKNGVEDLEKARHYLDMLIQRERGEAITP